MKAVSRNRFALLAWPGALLALCVILPTALLRTPVAVALTGPATSAVQRAWEKVRFSDTYSVDSHIERTTYPLPALGNVGRQPQTDHIYLAGKRLQSQNLLELTPVARCAGRYRKKGM